MKTFFAIGGIIFTIGLFMGFLTGDLELMIFSGFMTILNQNFLLEL